MTYAQARIAKETNASVIYKAPTTIKPIRTTIISCDCIYDKNGKPRAVVTLRHGKNSTIRTLPAYIQLDNYSKGEIDYE